MKTKLKESRNSIRKREYKVLSENTKEGRSAKRARLKSQRSKVVRARLHAISNCGNPGCHACYPSLPGKPSPAAQKDARKDRRKAA